MVVVEAVAAVVEAAVVVAEEAGADSDAAEKKIAPTTIRSRLYSMARPLRSEIAAMKSSAFRA